MFLSSREDIALRIVFRSVCFSEATLASCCEALQREKTTWHTFSNLHRVYYRRLSLRLRSDGLRKSKTISFTSARCCRARSGRAQQCPPQPRSAAGYLLLLSLCTAVGGTGCKSGRNGLVIRDFCLLISLLLNAYIGEDLLFEQWLLKA